MASLSYLNLTSMGEPGPRCFLSAEDVLNQGRFLAYAWRLSRRFCPLAHLKKSLPRQYPPLPLVGLLGVPVTGAVPDAYRRVSAARGDPKNRWTTTRPHGFSTTAATCEAARGVTTTGSALVAALTLDNVVG